MIIQEVYWNDDKILTLCHEKMEKHIENRILEEFINISGNKIVFKEFNDENKDFTDFKSDFVIEGFLDCNHEKNPYGNYSTFYKEFVNQTDNSIVENNKLNVSDDEFEILFNFVKEYCNYPITASGSGNLIIFSPVKIFSESHNSETFPYLTLKGEDVKGTAIVKFKLNDIILESYIFEDVTNGYEIYSQGDWNNYEIEIFFENHLIYKAKYNIIRSIGMNIRTITNTMQKELLGTKKKINITKGIEDSFVISDNASLDSISAYLNIESSSIKKNKKLEKNLCKFLRKNERLKALSIFEELMSLSGEIWIYDPYAISDDNGGISGLINIVTLLCKTDNVKNIVFCETNGITFNKFKRELSENARDAFRGLNLKNLNFIKAKESFHDRFIFSKTAKSIIGYQMGTSLNSYGNNYSNIVKLDSLCSKEIFNILYDDIVSDNISNLEE